ncbi:MAG: endonuclease/exonuclease/phosphatase family protein [Bacilli bacterium]|nr:endonuclease/exonuclease/phosphatase family protein [Bacilli bacterium]
MRLNIGIYNICHGEGLDKIVDVKRQGTFLKEKNIDILLIQEVDINTERANINEIEELSTSIGHDYYYFGKNEDFLNGEYGNGIISKYEIIESNNYLTDVEKSHEMRGVCHSKIKINNTVINAISVHLPVFEEERIKYIKRLIEVIESIKNELIIIGGDFNTGIKKIGDHKYIYENKSEFIEYDMLKKYLIKLNNSEITWISETGKACIDTIFYSKEFKLVEYKNIENDYSDHSLLTVLLDV